MISHIVNLQDFSHGKEIVETTTTNLYILILYPSSEYINETFLISVRVASQFIIGAQKQVGVLRSVSQC